MTNNNTPVQDRLNRDFARCSAPLNRLPPLRIASMKRRAMDRYPMTNWLTTDRSLDLIILFGLIAANVVAWWSR
jgi:hypothetical protein